MKRSWLFVFLLSLCLCTAWGQDQDNNYLEDQFYAAFAYNFLLNKPETVVQQSLSYSLQLGFIKDLPLNKKRNFGLGLGFGYATNSYYTNLVTTELDSGIGYRLPLENEGVDRSKLETHALEFPFEIRWRTSNPVDYKFWRVYTGFKAEYLFSRRARVVTSQERLSFSNPNIEQWQFGWMFNFGYNTWNLHFYWALSDLLDQNAEFEGDTIDIRPIRIGVIFYIL